MHKTCHIRPAEASYGAGTFARCTTFLAMSCQGYPNMKTGVFELWKDAHFGRSEDQPLIFAILLVLIAITLYFLI